jgi:uncharacterized protein (DUF952 family)
MPPKYIYKICSSCTASDPKIPIDPTTSSLPPNTTLPASSLDTSSGYIHLSTAQQIPGTLQRFFASPASQRGAVVLLKVPQRMLEEAGGGGVLKWESPDGRAGKEGDAMVFPHAYFPDGRLGLSDAEVEGVREVVSTEGEEGWEDALGRLDGWLI